MIGMRSLGRGSSPRHLWLLLVCLVALARTLAAQTTDSTDGPLQTSHDVSRPHLIDNDTIIRMSKAGLGDDVLIQTIQMQPGHYLTGPDDLITLKQAGLSDRVISAMQAHGTGLAIRGAPRPPTVASDEPIALSPVNEIGVYYKDANGRWQPMESEPVHAKSSGWLKNTLSDGIVKTDMNGMVNGPESKLLLPRPVEFLIYTADGVDAGEYDLIRFRLNGKDREFRTLTGGVFHSTGGAKGDEVEFKATRIAPRTWTFTLPKDTPGAEYGILPPGTGNITNGGKIYTFASSE
jgi:hypothetical protein